MKGLWCLTPLSTIFQLYRGGDWEFKKSHAYRRSVESTNLSVYSLKYFFLFKDTMLSVRVIIDCICIQQNFIFYQQNSKQKQTQHQKLQHTKTKNTYELCFNIGSVLINHWHLRIRESNSLRRIPIHIHRVRASWSYGSSIYNCLCN